MKPKSNFVVEVKKSRRLDGTQKKRALWAGVDLDDAKRHEAPTSDAAPAPAATITDHGEAAAPTPGPQPRILPIIVEPAIIPEIQTAAAAMPEALSPDPPDDPAQPDDPAEDDPGAPPRRRRRPPRLRHWRQKPLPPGQRWKYRLPRILQKPD